jgi:hypothetical protein
MKKTVFLATTVFVIFAFHSAHVLAQQRGQGMMGPGYGYQQQEGWNYCPYCGSYMGPQSGYGRDPGMRHGGRGMGPGGMHRGWDRGSQYGPQYGPGYEHPQYRRPQKPMEEKDAKELLEGYLESTRNPNLELGKIADKGNAFEAEIRTKDGSLVDKILVDKRTGWMRSVY